MIWKNCKDELPPENKYVLARHSRGTWFDSDDQENVNCIVVKLVKGISHEEREKLKALNDDRGKTYRSEDQSGNNLVPYCWKQFGPGKFFGQDIYCWTEIT